MANYIVYDSAPSPHHTPPPPPQRQGVIQRHNAHTGQPHNSSKPTSPAAPNKLHHMTTPMHQYPPPGITSSMLISCTK